MRQLGERGLAPRFREQIHAGHRFVVRPLLPVRMRDGRHHMVVAVATAPLASWAAGGDLVGGTVVAELRGEPVAVLVPGGPDRDG